MKVPRIRGIERSDRLAGGLLGSPGNPLKEFLMCRGPRGLMEMVIFQFRGNFGWLVHEDMCSDAFHVGPDIVFVCCVVRVIYTMTWCTMVLCNTLVCIQNNMGVHKTRGKQMLWNMILFCHKYTHPKWLKA